MKAVALEFFYSDGEKMSYREVRVFSPRDEKFAAQTGRTDEAGRFAFVPDCPGEWRVIVRDEKGHQCVGIVGVRDEGLGVRDEGLGVRDEGLGVRDEGLGIPQGVELAIRALLGVSVIFNIAMIVRSRHNAHQ
jgi:nickel transport protein